MYQIGVKLNNFDRIYNIHDENSHNLYMVSNKNGKLPAAVKIVGS